MLTGPKNTRPPRWCMVTCKMIIRISKYRNCFPKNSAQVEWGGERPILVLEIFNQSIYFLITSGESNALRGSAVNVDRHSAEL